MKNSGKQKISYNELLERVKELEQENESMAERAGEVLLLSILGDTISTLEEKQELMEELLEKISILKYIPWCSCYELVNGKYKLVECYVEAPYKNQCPKEIVLSKGAFGEIQEKGIYCGYVNGIIENKYELPVTEKTELLIIKFQNNWIKNGIFLFMDEKKRYSLKTKILVVRQAINMVLERIEKLSYIKQIEQLNKGLEIRVVERTKALSQINSKLLNEIEERKAIEEELRLAKNKAEDSDKLKSVFLANMSHEIRTPMNAIVGFSELMESGTCEESELKEFSRLIYGNSLSLLNLINDLLDFSKIEANQLTLHCACFNINQILDDVNSLGMMLLKQYKKNNIKIEVRKSSPDNSAIIFTDGLRLKQILINLLSNAIKFSFQGVVVIEYKMNRRSVDFSVEDNGIGIAAEKQSLIFNRFSRVSDDITKPIAGNGLGLAISKTLVEMLGGKISVESSIGQGSIFRFDILSKAVCGENCIVYK
ncbi:sensor histidine kinase [Saccharicrinis sp. 156]|uniref:sensor histidine kinase n=1 Tax=Saccharicrinis sp. 156 TaxID=3417574 RepID=UPI003D355B81